MIELNIPGQPPLQIEHLVTDVNGTIALDGRLFEGLARTLNRLRDRLDIHLLTANTHGNQDLIDRQIGFSAVRIRPGDEARQKADYVRNLGPERTAAIGQGANDSLMLKTAAIGICVLSTEGVAVETLLAADMVVPDIQSALALFDKPTRLVATLRK